MRPAILPPPRSTEAINEKPDWVSHLRPFEKSMTPRETVQEWVRRFNAADAAGLSEMYHPDAINHQVANEPVIGREAITIMFIREFAAAEMVCIPENIFEDGSWAVLEWRDPMGLRGCGFFQVEDGKIKFQRGYWDKLSFLKLHNLPIPL